MGIVQLFCNLESLNHVTSNTDSVHGPKNLQSLCPGKGLSKYLLLEDA